MLAPRDADKALAAIRAQGLDGRLIGRVAGNGSPGGSGRVILKSRIGTRRILDMPSGEQLPRIC
jgi:hydrogenase expression/formation protein HypE